MERGPVATVLNVGPSEDGHENETLLLVLLSQPAGAGYQGRPLRGIASSIISRLRAAPVSAGFAAFSDKWHTRMRAEQPHDALEFDAFREVLASGPWHTRTADGVVSPIEDAPVFMKGEISWLPADP